MRDALQILRKDARHLWPRMIPLLAITALLGVMECQPIAANPVTVSLRAMWVLAAAFLTVSVIQEESLPGHRQYWLTRPYSRGVLLLAKALFLALFAGAPMMLVEAISMAVNGVAPWRHLPLLAGTTLIFVGG